jgi:6-pyruvoyl-tetrahydropterin synthase
MPSFLTRRIRLPPRIATAVPIGPTSATRKRSARARRAHGHSYTCDVVVTGDIDPTTGMIVDRRSIAFSRRKCRERFDHRNINLDVPEFADGRLVPTGEACSIYLCARADGTRRHGDGG